MKYVIGFIILSSLLWLSFYFFQNTNSNLNLEETNKIVNNNYENNFIESKYKNKLNIPNLLTWYLEDWKLKFNLDINSSYTEIFSWYKTKTLWYNWSFLWPTIKVNKWDNVDFNIKNNLEEKTTVHWHGMHIPAKYDWWVFQPIKEGDVYNPNWKIDQPAATLWYHPHLMWKTAEQAYNWLAWMFIIEDEKSKALNIPKEYWVNDIPIIVQDRYVWNNWQFIYSKHMHTIIHWIQWNNIFVNWWIKNYKNVPSWVVRLRLLNWSNARVYNFNFKNSMPFYQIASDGWFLQKPVKLNNLKLSPWERAEILVDFSSFNIWESILLSSNYNWNNFDIMEFRVTQKSNNDFNIPDKLVDIKKIDQNNVKNRNFTMKTMERWMRWKILTINWKNMDINRVDEYVDLNSTEIWTIKNQRSMWMNVPHSFHIHDVQFQIIERNWKKPPKNERWWKDTVFLEVWEEVKVIMQFKDYTWKYMYHCHILEHEDNWMMWVFEVIDQ